MKHGLVRIITAPTETIENPNHRGGESDILPPIAEEAVDQLANGSEGLGIGSWTFAIREYTKTSSK